LAEKKRQNHASISSSSSSLGDCSVFMWAVNNKVKQYMMSITCFQLLFCFVLFAFLAPALSIDWCFVTLCDKVVPHGTYAPSHQACWNVFLLVSEKHMYILSSGQKPKEKCFDQSQTCYDRPKQIWGIHWSKRT
jgi:hypothetical protein